MSELAKRLNQCRKPTGGVGKLVVDDMNKTHFELTGWGLDKIKIKEDSIVLDVGCGGGKTVNRLASLAPKGKIFGIDYSLDCVNWSKQYNEKLVKDGQVEITHASVEKIPFEDDKFDIITAVETIYFWPNLSENLEEIRRVLKPAGKFVVINEVYSSEIFKERNEKYKTMGDMAIHSPQEMKELLEKSQYNNIKISVVEERNWLCCVSEK